MNILKALKRSSLGLDLYLWLAYRTFALTRPLRLSPGGSCTASSGLTRPRRATSAQLITSARKAYAS